ncbi:hypothetical protein GCM10025864_19600 [Luteimicrobium album]|uniref:Fibronectin type-III domain-containing protein n=1 Tax=Luteimicrobium album TaxID=1054550 RepID=A0ABQ6I0I9_9MICO|nr:hypothetical protein GCM10025864_19600 [Luteimicrobium album]
MCGIVDGTAPRLTVHGPASATKAVNGKATVTVSYQATDDTWVKSYDVRYKRAAKGSTTYGARVYPSSWQGTTAWSKSVTATTGQRVCLSVRARDGANNVSAWSSSRCTFADGTKPKLTKVVAPGRWYGVPKSGKVRATVRLADKDDHALRFDVRVRKATVKGPLGPGRPSPREPRNAPPRSRRRPGSRRASRSAPMTRRGTSARGRRHAAPTSPSRLPRRA